MATQKFRSEPEQLALCCPKCTLAERQSTDDLLQYVLVRLESYQRQIRAVPQKQWSEQTKGQARYTSQQIGTVNWLISLNNSRGIKDEAD